MKQFFTCVALLVFTLTISCKKGKDNPNWPPTLPADTSKPVNPGKWVYAGNIIDANDDNAQAVIKVDKYGTAYVLFRDGYNAKKATVMKLVDSTWTPVGSAGFSDTIANRLAMAIDESSGALYVSYIESTTADRVRVMKYDGSSWKLVGSAFFQTNANCVPSISVDNAGAPCVSYISFLGQAMFKKFDGTSWVDYFTADYKLKSNMVSVIAGTNYLCYLWDTAFKGNKLEIMKMQGTGYTNLNFSAATQPFSFSTTTDNDGTLYVAYENKEPGRQANLMKYYGSWSGIGKSNFSQGVANGITAAITADSVYTPYVMFRDGNNTAYVMRYFDKQWEIVGELSSGEVSHTSIAVDKDFVPYAAMSTTLGKSVIVKRFK